MRMRCLPTHVEREHPQAPVQPFTLFEYHPRSIDSRSTMRAPILVVLFISFALGACSMPKLGLPRVHKITIQQGNVITQEMVDQLKPGMTRNQVRFVLGDPVMRNRFNANRWDYVYVINIPGQFEEQKNLSLFFEQDQLKSFSGDFTPTGVADASAPASATESATESVADSTITETQDTEPEESVDPETTAPEAPTE